jgi:hypothetical protein
VARAEAERATARGETEHKGRAQPNRAETERAAGDAPGPDRELLEAERSDRGRLEAELVNVRADRERLNAELVASRTDRERLEREVAELRSPLWRPAIEPTTRLAPPQAGPALWGVRVVAFALVAILLIAAGVLLGGVL